MELRVTGFTREQMDHLDAQAAGFNMTRTAYVKLHLLGSNVRPITGGVGRAARGEGTGRQHRAFELLWRRTAPPV